MMTRDEVSRTRRRTRQPRGLTYAEQETAPKVRPEPKKFLHTVLYYSTDIHILT